MINITCPKIDQGVPDHLNTSISIVNPYQNYPNECISEKETKQISVKVDHIYTISMKLYLGLTQG